VRYRVLADFAYYLCHQETVETAYPGAEEWGRRAILNIAGMASFSSNHAVHGYAELIRTAVPLGGETVEANRAGRCDIAAAE